MRPVARTPAFGHLSGHLGSRVTALLDGRLPAAEEERAWEHVHRCHPCRDAVEREGWVKTRLAELGCAGTTPPSSLRESLLDASFLDARGAWTPAPAHVRTHHHAPRIRHLVALGGSALGVAVVGVMALGAPANAPQLDRRGPVTSIVPPAASTNDGRLAVTRPSVPSVATSVRGALPEETMAP